jgi:hypothetical protein
MSRKHLFAIVLLLAAAAVAGLLAVTRTVALGGGVAPTSNAQVTAKTRSLDRLEASLKRALADQRPTVPSSRPAAASSAQPLTIYVPSTASAQASAGERGEPADDHGRGDDD